MIDVIKKLAIGAGKKILATKPVVRRGKKGGGNWATDADIESERYIVREIKNRFPTHLILSEETHSNFSNLDRAEHLWVVDPLDGTTNATFGIPFYCVSIAYVERGVVVAASVYDPLRGELFWAEIGKGACLNGSTLHVQDRKNFAGGVVNIDSPYLKHDFKKTYPTGEKFFQKGARIVNLGSVALECAYIAAGRLSLYYGRGKSWDIAAGSLIVSESGGVTDSLSRPFSLFHPREIIVGNTYLVAIAKKIL